MNGADLVLRPRLLIGGTHSGVGKTSLAVGLMAAFTRRGLRVDSHHRIPKLELLLAAVLSDRHSYQEAAQHMRNFVNLLPPGAESDDAQKKVHQLEQLSAKAEVAQ